MAEPVDFLKIKIEKAKENLPRTTREAIDAVPWKEIVYEMRQKKSLSLTQLEDLELETELVLSGLVAPAAYPKELTLRLGLPASQIDAIVEEMNERVFKKIREELVQRLNRNQNINTFPIKKIEVAEPKKENTTVSKIPIKPEPSTPSVKVVQTEEIAKNKQGDLINSILGQKLSGLHVSSQIKTEYSIGNIAKEGNETKKNDWRDPYRLKPGE